MHIVVKGEEVQVHRKLSGLNDKARTLVEVFDMAEEGRPPEVEEGL